MEFQEKMTWEFGEVFKNEFLTTPKERMLVKNSLRRDMQSLTWKLLTESYLVDFTHNVEEHIPKKRDF